MADEYNLHLIDVRLSQMEPAEILGFPQIQDGRMKYIPADLFPLDIDEIPDGKEGFMLFLDEINSAPLSVQAAAYRLILDKEVGNHKLHPNTVIVAAGNKATDKAIVNRMSTATQSRMIHLNLTADSESWLEWADTADIDYRIKGFIGFRPDLLMNFNPNHSDNTFASPRTWAFTSKLIKNWDDLNRKLPVLAGTIGEGAAVEFTGFCDIYGKLPTIKHILEKPHEIEISDDPSIQFALSSLVAAHATKDNLSKLIKFIDRMPSEFKVLTIKSVVRMDPTLNQHPELNKWMVKNANKLMR